MIEKLPVLVTSNFEPHWLTISNDLYHADKSSISASGLKHLLKSPAHFKYEWMKSPKDKTPAQRMGELFHAAILEPERFRENMVIQPDFNRRTNAGKAAEADFLSKLPETAIVVSEDDYHWLCGAIESVYSHPIARGALRGGERELTGVFRDPETGLKCRIRPDLIIRDKNIILDVKTCQDASQRAVERVIWQYAYDLQAAFYLHGSQIIEQKVYDTYLWLFVEKTAPYVTTLWKADQAWLEIGSQRMKRSLHKLTSSIEAGEFPGYQNEAEWISPPDWAMKGLDDGIFT